MVPGIQQRQLVARDGARIGYQLRGALERPCVVFANGLGGQYIAFRDLYAGLGDAYRVVCWDYRGLYTSSPPPDPRANTIAHQVDDLIEILDREGIGDVVIVGWSMGVQVAFELVRRHRARVRGILAVNGTSGRAFQTVLGSRLIGSIIPTLLKLVRAQAGLVGRATRMVAGRDVLIDAMKRFELVSPRLDVEIFRAVAAGFKDIDWVIYADLLARLDEHDAAEVLPTIAVPTAIVTGDRDVMTPPATAERLHRQIAGSRLVVIEGGSHYTPCEYPEILNDELARLLSRIPGWERAPASAQEQAS